VRILISVPAESEQGALPEAAQFLVTETLLDKLECLHQVLANHSLASIATFDTVEVWGEPSFAALHRLSNDELVLSPEGFRFVASGPSIGRVATAVLDVPRFARACRAHSGSAQLQFDAAGGLVRSFTVGAPCRYAEETT